MADEPVLAERGAVRLVWRRGSVWAVMGHGPDAPTFRAAPAVVDGAEDVWGWEAEEVPEDEWQKLWDACTAQDPDSWQRDEAGLYWLGGPASRPALVAWLTGTPEGVRWAGLDQWWACGRDAEGPWLAPVADQGGVWAALPGVKPARVPLEANTVPGLAQELLTVADARWVELVSAVIRVDQVRRRHGQWPPRWNTAPDTLGMWPAQHPLGHWRETGREAEITWPNLVSGDTVIWRVRPTGSLEDPGVIYVTKGMGAWTLAIHREGLRWQDAGGRMMRRLTEREGWALRQLWAEGTQRRLAWANRVQAMLTAGEWTLEWWDSDPCLENGQHERAPLTGWLVHLQEGNGVPPIQQVAWTVEDDGRGRGDMLTWTVNGRRGWMICYPSGEIEVQGTTRRCWVVPELQAVWVDVCEEPGSGSGAHSHP